MRSQQISKRTSVLVVKKTIQRGVSIEANCLAPLSVPADMVDSRFARSIDEVVGHVATSTMLEGEFVMNAKLTSNKADSGIAALIPEGMRAKSITAINLADRVSGLIDVGDRVDILLSRSSPRSSEGKLGMSETLLQNVEVLAVDRLLSSKGGRSANPTTNKQETKSSSITVLVTPEQASLLSLAQGLGVLSFSLRNPEDHTIFEEPFDDNKLSQLVMKNRLEARFAQAYQAPGESFEDTPDSGNFTEPLGPDVVLPEDAPVAGSKKRASAIRTIRGSRIGSVPISN